MLTRGFTVALLEVGHDVHRAFSWVTFRAVPKATDVPQLPGGGR